MKIPFYASKSIHIDALYIENITNNFIKIVFYHNEKLHYAFTTLRDVELVTEDSINYINNCIQQNKILKGKIHPQSAHMQLTNSKLEYNNIFPRKQIKIYELEMICPDTNKKINDIIEFQKINFPVFDIDSFELI